MISVRKVFDNKDLLTGVAFAIFGAGFLVPALQYSSWTELGPGTFPGYIGIALVLTGLVLVVKAPFHDAMPVRFSEWRPLLAVVAGLLVFAFTLPLLGILINIFLIVGLTKFAQPDLRWAEVVGLSILLCALVVGVFIYGLGLPIPILPRL